MPDTHSLPEFSLLNDLMAQLRQHANPDNAKPMAAYMKGRFPFLGIPTPQRRMLSKKAVGQSGKLPLKVLCKFIDTLYTSPQREFHYVALDMLVQNSKRFQPEDIDKMVLMLDQHAWWDSVDTLRKALSLWFKSNPVHLPVYMAQLLAQESFWQRRVAITLQLGWQEQTDTDWLRSAILKNLEDREFFIQKGIGWALRDYSKYNAMWVSQLFSEQRFSALAIREGSKYIEP